MRSSGPSAPPGASAREVAPPRSSDVAPPSGALVVYARLAMLGALVTGLMILLDPRELAGEPLWLKPTKFFLSSAIATATVEWILRRSGLRSRLQDVCRAIIAWGMGVEMVIICAQAARGVRSHFNFATSLDAVLFSVMGLVITGVVVAMGVAVVSATGAGSRLTRAERMAARWGIGLFVAAAFLGNLMVRVTPAQRALDSAGGWPAERGSHFVGSVEGATRTLPITGWSRESGDLRVPHFVGMHGIQVLMLVVAWLRWRGWSMDDASTARRVAALGVWMTLFWGVTLGQALGGRSLVEPGVWRAILLVTIGVGLGIVASLVGTRRGKVVVA